ncbi:hypothetical protein [Rubellimicrobium rubrum]|uniref:hypothetical protein n=1 Tax=Rubellimicrobium rubrum TaxID=2585369 RepID=UPI00159BCD34|nr:hypothetical protein [Rubellimicrobium rubrum]
MLDCFEERVAIREFDGGLGRQEAERAALGETAAAYGVAPEVLAQRIRQEARQ